MASRNNDERNRTLDTCEACGCEFNLRGEGFRYHSIDAATEPTSIALCGDCCDEAFEWDAVIDMPDSDMLTSTDFKTLSDWAKEQLAVVAEQKKGGSMKTWITKLNGSEFKVMRLNDAPAADVALDTPEVVENYLRPKLADSIIYRPDVENFIVIFLNARKKPIGFQIISTGTLDTLLVHPREVFKPAIVMNAHSILLAHNHPSGDWTPSEADIKVTRELVKAGNMMKIEVVDHIILGEAKAGGLKTYASLR